MSNDEKVQEAQNVVKSKLDEVVAIQKQDKGSSLLIDYGSKNSSPEYSNLSPMTHMRERTKEFPNDSNDYKARLHDIAWSSQNDIAFVGQANDLVISDGNSGYWKNIIKLPSMALSVTFSPNGNLVSTACLDATNSCRIYNVTAETDTSNSDDSKNNGQTLEDQLTKPHRSIDHSEGMVISHPFLNDREILAGSKNIVYLWDVETGKPNGIFDNKHHNGHSDKTEVSALTAMNKANKNANEQLFLSGDDSGTMKLWDIRESNENKCAMTWHESSYFETEVSCVQFFPNNECFMAGSKDGTLRLFDIRRNYKQLSCYRSWYQVKKNKQIPLTALKLSKSGRFVFAAFDDTEDDDLNWNLVECIEVVTGKSCQQFRHDSVVPGLALSPDGHSIVTACWNGKIRKFSSM